MPRTYKHRNGRLVHRRVGGQFRKSTLADIGMGHCEDCNCLFTVEVSNGEFIDPRQVNLFGRKCPACRGSTEPKKIL